MVDTESGPKLPKTQPAEMAKNERFCIRVPHILPGVLQARVDRTDTRLPNNQGVAFVKSLLSNTVTV
jgi:hypothetical protein